MASWGGRPDYETILDHIADLAGQIRDTALLDIQTGQQDSDIFVAALHSLSSALGKEIDKFRSDSLKAADTEQRSVSSQKSPEDSRSIAETSTYADSIADTLTYADSLTDRDETWTNDEDPWAAFGTKRAAKNSNIPSRHISSASIRTISAFSTADSEVTIGGILPPISTNLSTKEGDQSVDDPFGFELCKAVAGNEPPKLLIPQVTNLLDAGADPNVRDEWFDGVLYDKFYRSLCVKPYSKSQAPPVLYVAVSAGANIEVIRLLLDRGAKANAEGGYFGYALTAAAQTDRKDVVHLLLERGADVNARLSMGEWSEVRCALTEAASSGTSDIVELLLDYGADINVRAGSYGCAITAAVTCNRYSVVRLLLDRGAVTFDQNRSLYHDPLCQAILHHREPILQLLLERGVNPALRGKELTTFSDWPLRKTIIDLLGSYGSHYICDSPEVTEPKPKTPPPKRHKLTLVTSSSPRFMEVQVPSKTPMSMESESKWGVDTTLDWGDSWAFKGAIQQKTKTAPESDPALEPEDLWDFPKPKEKMGKKKKLAEKMWMEVPEILTEKSGDAVTEDEKTETSGNTGKDNIETAAPKSITLEKKDEVAPQQSETAVKEMEEIDWSATSEYEPPTTPPKKSKIGRLRWSFFN